MVFVVPTVQEILKKKEISFKTFYLTKKFMEHEGDGHTNFNWPTWNNPQPIGKETR